MNSEGYNLKLNSKHPSLSHTSHCIVSSLYYIFKRLKKILKCRYDKEVWEFNGWCFKQRTWLNSKVLLILKRNQAIWRVMHIQNPLRNVSLIYGSSIKNIGR